MGIAVTVWPTRKLTELYRHSGYLISPFPAAATSSQLPINHFMSPSDAKKPSFSAYITSGSYRL